MQLYLATKSPYATAQVATATDRINMSSAPLFAFTTLLHKLSAQIIKYCHFSCFWAPPLSLHFWFAISLLNYLQEYHRISQRLFGLFMRQSGSVQHAQLQLCRAMKFCDKIVGVTSMLIISNFWKTRTRWRTAAILKIEKPSYLTCTWSRLTLVTDRFKCTSAWAGFFAR